MIYRNEDVPYAFFHVPRTSGTNIGHYLEIRCGGRVCCNTNSPALHHSTYAAEARHKDLSGFYKFGFVRNPYSRDYSLYTLHSQVTSDKLSFKEWIFKRYSDYTGHGAQNFRLPQYGYFCDESGMIQVNVFRFEERDLALEIVAEVLNTDSKALISHKPDYVPGDMRYHSIRRGSIDDYRQKFDNEMIDFVTPFYQLDMDAFGYTFDGFKDPTSVEFKLDGHPDFYSHNYVNPELLESPYINV